MYVTHIKLEGFVPPRKPGRLKKVEFLITKDGFVRSVDGSHSFSPNVVEEMEDSGDILYLGTKSFDLEEEHNISCDSEGRLFVIDSLYRKLNEKTFFQIPKS